MRKRLKFEVNAGFTDNGKKTGEAEPDVMLAFFNRVSVFMTPEEARMMAAGLNCGAADAERMVREHARRNK